MTEIDEWGYADIYVKPNCMHDNICLEPGQDITISI